MAFRTRDVKDTEEEIPRRMTETEEAIALANKVLDRVNADPDDDIAILARQFLRAREMIERLQGELGKIADPLLLETPGIGLGKALNMITTMQGIAKAALPRS